VDYGYNIEDVITLLTCNPGAEKFRDALQNPHWGCAIEKAFGLRLTFAVWMHVVFQSRNIIETALAAPGNGMRRFNYEDDDDYEDRKRYIRWQLDFIFHNYLKVNNGQLEQSECNVLLSLYRLQPSNLTHPNRAEWPNYLLGKTQYIPNHCTECRSLNHTDKTCPNTTNELSNMATIPMDIEGFENLIDDAATDDSIRETLIEVLGDEDWLETMTFDPDTTSDTWEDPTETDKENHESTQDADTYTVSETAVQHFYKDARLLVSRHQSAFPSIGNLFPTLQSTYANVTEDPFDNDYLVNILHGIFDSGPWPATLEEAKRISYPTSYLINLESLLGHDITEQYFRTVLTASYKAEYKALRRAPGEYVDNKFKRRSETFIEKDTLWRLSQEFQQVSERLLHELSHNESDDVIDITHFDNHDIDTTTHLHEPNYTHTELGCAHRRG
jgi:hypothetical protein